MFNVFYVDDANRKHITVAQDLSEVRFIQDRFDYVEFEPISKEINE